MWHYCWTAHKQTNKSNVEVVWAGLSSRRLRKYFCVAKKMYLTLFFFSITSVSFWWVLFIYLFFLATPSNECSLYFATVCKSHQPTVITPQGNVKKQNKKASVRLNTEPSEQRHYQSCWFICMLFALWVSEIVFLSACTQCSAAVVEIFW